MPKYDLFPEIKGFCHIWGIPACFAAAVLLGAKARRKGIAQNAFLALVGSRGRCLLLKIAMAQVNPTVGDLSGNTQMILRTIRAARQSSAEIIVFPELVITGYPPQDLLYEREFVKANKDSLSEIARKSRGLVTVVGFVDYDDAWNLYNSAAVLANGRVVGIARKTLLPTYDVFDEDRYFKREKPERIHPISIKTQGREVKLGVQICEDLWDENYENKVTDILVQRGADLIFNVSSSPFSVGKVFERLRLLTDKATRNGVPVFLVNLVGGQDELVFDGQSLAVDSKGKPIAWGKAFEEDLVMVDMDLVRRTAKKVRVPSYDRTEEMHDALVLGIRDYFRKTGFSRAVLGLSGGIDSSVTACIAAEALGPANVIGLSMPSKYSTDHSKTDAEQLAENLGIHYLVLPVQSIVDSYHAALAECRDGIRSVFHKANDEDPVADENIQPRVRGNCLMDISNRFKDLRILVLNTGNKTELALGFCTLYGDMSGGVGVLGDVSKLQVYELAHFINGRSKRQVIPSSILEKPPSPELKDNQFDPFNFDIVSPMVDEIIENRRSRRELIEMGYPESVVNDTYSRIRRAEYKRWQAPPCIKISRRSFGIGWKMPIVNHYRG